MPKTQQAEPGVTMQFEYLPLCEELNVFEVWITALHGSVAVP